MLSQALQMICILENHVRVWITQIHFEEVNHAINQLIVATLRIVIFLLILLLIKLADGLIDFLKRS